MNLQNLPFLPNIAVGGREKFCPDELLMLVADVNYTHIHLRDGKMVIVAKTLKELESRLCQYKFFRPHKSFLINLQCVAAYNCSPEWSIKMENDAEIFLSRRKRTAFQRLMIANKNFVTA